VPLLLPDSGLLVLPSNSDQRVVRSGGVGRLTAWRLADGERAFDYDLFPLQNKLRWVFSVAEGIAIYGLIIAIMILGRLG